MYNRRQFMLTTIATVPALAQKQKDAADCSPWKDALTAQITADSKTMRLDLQSETFDDSDAYRLAIADLVRDHFLGWIIVDPDAKTKLRVTGSNLNGSTQLVEIEFGWNAAQLVRTGLNPVVFNGFFRYMSGGGLIAGDRSERIGLVREAAYSLLSRFQKDSWHKVIEQ